jgi:molecular chaperone HtpG
LTRYKLTTKTLWIGGRQIVPAEHRFQVHLRGIIDLLGNHLYSRPELYLRELLQNGVDAITARRQMTPDFQGNLQLEVDWPARKQPTLTVIDNGIGMTEAEVHSFLATIGESSKRADHAGDKSVDFLGQFGIGMLAGFMVSDDIVVITRSAREGHPAIEWRGHLDGSYEVRVLDAPLAPGTRVHLTARRANEDLFSIERIEQLALYYGGLLPYPVRFVNNGGSRQINSAPIPWRQQYVNERERTSALLEYGRLAFGANFLDAIPLASQAGGADGVAFVLPHAANLASRRAHRVYLKNMLLSEAAENLLPDWAVFVKAIVNVEHLRPTASRESFYEDERLEATRAELGAVLRQYLCDLAQRDQTRFERFLSVHHLALKALAAEDEDSYRAFIDWLPFETTQGRKTVRELRSADGVIRYVNDVGQYHQIAKVATAQGQTLVNAGYVFEAELLARLADVFPDCEPQLVDPAQWTHDFEELTPDELDRVDGLIDAAYSVLRPHRCSPEVRKFRPVELPALFAADGEARFYRSLEHAQESADPLFSGVLASMASQRSATPTAVLCLNYNNSLVQRLARVSNPSIIARCVEILYVQSLLLAQQPLTTKELTLMNRGLSGLIESVLSTEG